MNGKEFDDQMQQRVVTIKKMAKVDIMGARREVDQLRREFVTALASSEGGIIPLGLWKDIAKELDELDKFDMPLEKLEGKSRIKRETIKMDDENNGEDGNEDVCSYSG